MTEHTDPANTTPPSVDRVSALWRRVNEHKLVQWTVAYVALAYGIQHGVTLTAEAFDWPHAVERVTMLLLILGLPLVMTLAWYHGARASRQFSHAELSILSALLVIGAGLFYVFARPAENLAGPRGTTVAQNGEMSIAVLPFANLSGDANQEFFSDGMTDEIMTALAKVQALRVVGRESAYQFKGQKADNRAMGQALGARYLIEGSVRKAGDQVRITAQLVQADNGVSLWTDSYDRELKNIFATQSDIAQAIAGALRVPLGLKQGESLVPDRTADLELYDRYLRAKALVRTRGSAVTEAAALLEDMVARDPNYAPAWALLARSYLLVTDSFRGGPVEETRQRQAARNEKAEMAARRAVQLDPENAAGYSALATLQAARGKLIEAEDFNVRALAAAPGDPDVLHVYSQFLDNVGRVKQALEMRQKLRMLEPFVPVFNSITASLMQQAGQYKESIAILEALPPDALRFTADYPLARAYAAEGRFAEAADKLLLLDDNNGLGSRRAVEDAARLLRSAPAKAAEPLPDLEGLFFVYAYVGAPDRMMDFLERELAVDARVGELAGFTRWSALSTPLRKTERFKAYVRKAGLVDYWKARGWPDLCHPVGADDFACN